MKRQLRVTGNEDINKIVWEWFVSARARNLPISGTMLQHQVREVAGKLGKEDFSHFL